MNKKSIIITLAVLVVILLVCVAVYTGGDILMQTIMEMHGSG